jgi:hypothetical protein
VLIALGLLAGMFMYLTDIPIALKSVTDPTARLGLKKALAKSLVQGVIYVTAFSAAGIAAWRHTRRRPGMAKGAAV